MKSFPITEGDVAAETETKQKVRPIQKHDRVHTLNEDVLWVLETDLHRYRQTLQNRTGPLTDKEHQRLIKTAEQLRKMRRTEADIARANATSELDDLELDEEFESRCAALGLDADAVLEALGLKE